MNAAGPSGERFAAITLVACISLMVLVILQGILSWAWWILLAVAGGLLLAFLVFLGIVSLGIHREETAYTLPDSLTGLNSRLARRRPLIMPGDPIHGIHGVQATSNNVVEIPGIFQRLPAALALWATRLAVLLAGRHHPDLSEEWLTHLGGETGHDTPTWRKIGTAAGFVIAAIRLRLQDAADVMWIPADAVLRSRTLSNLLVFVPVFALMEIIFRHGGLYGLATNADNIIAFGLMLFGVIHGGRRWRHVKPPKAKPRRAKK